VHLLSALEAQRLGGAIQAGRTARDQHQAGAIAREATRRLQPDPAGAARDQRDRSRFLLEPYNCLLSPQLSARLRSSRSSRTGAGISTSAGLASFGSMQSSCQVLDVLRVGCAAPGGRIREPAHQRRDPGAMRCEWR
jgi:hypothetical protein